MMFNTLPSMLKSIINQRKRQSLRVIIIIIDGILSDLEKDQSF